MRELLVTAIALVCTACTTSRGGPPTRSSQERRAPVAAADSSKLWFWFASCSDPHYLNLRVLLDEKPLYARTFPVCHLPRDATLDRVQSQAKLTFTFRAPRPMVWWGYRAEEGHAETTATAVSFDTQIWEAGADPDVLLLGVVVGASDGLHMNTIHITRPVAADTTEVADGLVVVTTPVARPPL